jgi:hypothetical protein
MTSSATLIKSETLGGSPNPPATSPGEQSSPDAHAIETGETRKRLPLSLLALGGALLAAGYALFIEKMRFGPPLVMFALGGMTLALTAAALLRMIDPLAGNVAVGASTPTPGRRRTRELEREKQLVLKAIKEIELDYQMRKIAERDYREMVERYRTRALRLMTEIDAGDDYRTLIEKELAIRLKLQAGKPAPAPTAAPAPRACPACSTVNDDDAQFCKKCGVKLSAV